VRAGSSATRVRFLAGGLCALAMLQVSAGVVAGAVAPTPRSCVVPMPCCERGVCPLHGHGASRPGDGPRWLRCDDDAPLRLPAAGPPAVLARRLTVPAPRFAERAASGARVSPPTRAPEPELRPPESPAAS
jgi:hypothetical protein